MWFYCCACVLLCVRVGGCACGWVGGCGCPGGLTGEVWAHNPEDTGSDPRAGGKFLFEKVPPAHPSVKRVPGLVLGSKAHWLCLIIH